MADKDTAQSWWHTLPGILTGVAGVITALGALAAALHQAGWLGSGPTSAIAADTVSTMPPAAPAGLAGTPPANMSTQAVPAARAVALPTQREYRVDTVAFTLLAATLSPRNAEQDTLTLRLRMHNRDSFPQPFWDRDFRLLVDSLPSAPAEQLGELVESEAAKDGELLFLLPRDTAAAVLRIHRGNERTEIPLDFTKRAG